MNAEWSDVPPGTIVDVDMIRLASSGLLIVEHFDRSLVKQACYELRASDIFYDLQSSAEDKQVTVEPGEGYLLQPHCQVVCITMESLSLPSNVLGRILTKGVLFSIGILPVTTYADPGFSGRLGITLHNASNRHIIIKPGQAIAKIEFSLLSKAVASPYSGQHGYETKIWPIATPLYAKLDDPKIAAQLGSVDESLHRSYGPQIAGMARDLRFYRYGVWVQLLLLVVSFGIIFRMYDQLSFFGSVSLGIFSNLLTNVLIHLLAKSRFARRLDGRS